MCFFFKHRTKGAKLAPKVDHCFSLYGMLPPPEQLKKTKNQPNKTTICIITITIWQKPPIMALPVVASR